MNTIHFVKEKKRQILDLDDEIRARFLHATIFHETYLESRCLKRDMRWAAQYTCGTLLDIGCGKKPYYEIFAPSTEQYIGLDYPPTAIGRNIDFSHIDVLGDATRLPLAECSVDAILLSQVIEHLPNPFEAISEVKRVLKPNGILIVTAPFLYPIHGQPDLFRYTQYGLESLAQRHGFEVIFNSAHGSFWTFLGESFNVYFFHKLFRSNGFMYLLSLVLRPLILALVASINLACLLMENIHRQKNFALGNTLVARSVEQERSHGR